MRARARSIALVLVGVLASTSSVGIVLWNSQSEGTDEVLPAVDASAEVNAGDIAFSHSPLATLQYGEGLLDEIQAFDPAHGGARFPVSDLVSSTKMPLSVDMGLMHVQAGGATGASGPSLGYAKPSYGRGPTTLSMRRGGGIAGTAGKNFNPESDGTDEVDEPGPVDEQEQPSGPIQSPGAPNNEEGPTGPGPTEPGPTNPGPDPELNPPVSVPEPGTLGLLAMGMAGLLLARRKARAPIV